eukprot:c10455_g2_i1 orf=3-434(-)
MPTFTWGTSWSNRHEGVSGHYNDAAMCTRWLFTRKKCKLRKPTEHTHGLNDKIDCGRGPVFPVECTTNTPALVADNNAMSKALKNVATPAGGLSRPMERLNMSTLSFTACSIAATTSALSPPKLYKALYTAMCARGAMPLANPK